MNTRTDGIKSETADNKTLQTWATLTTSLTASVQSETSLVLKDGKFLRVSADCTLWHSGRQSCEYLELRLYDTPIEVLPHRPAHTKMPLFSEKCNPQSHYLFCAA